MSRHSMISPHKLPPNQIKPSCLRLFGDGQSSDLDLVIVYLNGTGNSYSPTTATLHVDQTTFTNIATWMLDPSVRVQISFDCDDVSGVVSNVHFGTLPAFQALVEASIVNTAAALDSLSSALAVIGQQTTELVAIAAMQGHYSTDDEGRLKLASGFPAQTG